MIDRDRVIEQIRQAFDGLEFPGDAFLQGSYEGTEPSEVTAPFRGVSHWRDVAPAVLDANYTALSFFSEAGFRYFLPAYLIADLRDQLQTADPIFHLTHGFLDSSVPVETPARVFDRKLGKHVLMNPRRYGAMTFMDYARFRLSIFTREEARAIVAYLEYMRQSDRDGLRTKEIDGALESFWADRAAHAPEQEVLARHREEEAAFLRAIRDRRD